MVGTARRAVRRWFLPERSPRRGDPTPTRPPSLTRYCILPFAFRPRSYHNLPVKQCVVVLDLEGVLVPEIWISVAEKTNIPELRRTTRDEPDFDKLMRDRIKILDQHGLKLSDIQDTIAAMKPLDGALDFLRQLRALTQVIILSDTFEEFAKPLMRQLEWPAIFCNRLIVEDGRIAGHQMRQPHPKRSSVIALKSLNYFIIAAGDSFNDIAMLEEAHAGFLFRAPARIREQFPRFPPLESYAELMQSIQRAMA